MDILKTDYNIRSSDRPPLLQQEARLTQKPPAEYQNWE